jgi:phosphate transport system substrate-binding protein
MKRILAIAVLVLAGMFLINQAFAAETLNGAGSSFAYPIYSAWAYNYQKVTGLQLNYQSIGSGGGIKQITDRTVDFGASDLPLSPADLQKSNLIQFPAVIGGVVPIVNIPGVKPNQMRLDSQTMCGIYLGEIKYWDNPQITALNPTMSLPHNEITVVHRSDGSGTTAIFTSYLVQTCPAWKEKVGTGVAVNWPVGIGGKGSEGVANYVQSTAYSVGYDEFAYAQQNNLTYTQLKNPAGQFVSPTFVTFENAAKTAIFDPKNDFDLMMTNAEGKDAWPIAGGTFVLLAKDKKDANVKTAKFYDWSFKQGDAKAKELIYIPLPKNLKDKIRAYWKANGINY